MAVHIPHNDISKALEQEPKQGKRQLEPFSSLMKSKNVPLAIVEDTNVYDNKAEVHTKTADLWRCLEGDVIFTVGGTLQSGAPRTLPDGSTDDTEWRARAIDNGEDITLRKGDWLYIPAGEPHTHRAKGTARLLIVKIPTRHD